MEEFNRKMELGRKLNKIMDKHGYNVNGLDNDMGEALKSYDEYNFITKGVLDGKTDEQWELMLNNKELYDEELEKRVYDEMEEFNRKIELGRKVKFIIDKHEFKKVGLSHELKDALKTYGLYGETKYDIYTCTYCENVKTYRLDVNEDNYKCKFCGNSRFVKTDEQWELMLNKKELYDEELEKRVYDEMEEFNRKIEIVRKVKLILDTN